MEVQQQYEGQVQIIGVPGSSSSAAQRAFITEQRADSFTHLAEADGLWEDFDVSEQGTYVFINDDGSWERKSDGSLADDVADLVAR